METHFFYLATRKKKERKGAKSRSPRLIRLCRSSGALFVSWVCPINMAPLAGLVQVQVDLASSAPKKV